MAGITYEWDLYPCEFQLEEGVDVWVDAGYFPDRQNPKGIIIVIQADEIGFEEYKQATDALGVKPPWLYINIWLEATTTRIRPRSKSYSSIFYKNGV